MEGVKKDGTVIPLYLSVSEVRQGGRITFTGMLRDITELKKYEAALTLAKERAEATSRELMEKQRRLDEDLEAAAGIQQALLPHNLPHLGSVEMDWRFMPSQSIGGDLFNAIPLGEKPFGYLHAGCRGPRGPLGFAHSVGARAAGPQEPACGQVRRGRRNTSHAPLQGHGASRCGNTPWSGLPSRSPSTIWCWI